MSQANGRVDLTKYNPFNKFKLYDRVNNNDKSTAYRDALLGNWQCNELSDTFFSAENIDALQRGMIEGVKSLSNNSIMIGRQDEDTLKIIMRSIFLQNAKNNNQPVQQQVEDLNKMVLNYAVPQIYGEAQGYVKYRNDVSTLVVPMDRPIATYTGKTLELKKWF